MIHTQHTSLSFSEQTRLSKRAKSQTVIAREFFNSHPDKAFTAEDVWSEIKKVHPGCDINSARRCCSNLKNEGYIYKHEGKKKKGRYDIFNHTYQRNISVQLTMEIN